MKKYFKMVKLSTLGALFLTSVSCNHYTILKENTVIDSVDIRLNDKWDLYVFDIASEGPNPSCGRAFIADYQFWSARHIFNEKGNDIINLGQSPIRGLQLCNEDHCRGDLFYYNTKTSTIFMSCSGEYIGEYYTINTSPIIRGDSGSPVICIKHEKVVGIVSKLYPLFVLEQGTDGYGGVVTKMVPDNSP